jgi:hypothetical protein
LSQIAVNAGARWSTQMRHLSLKTNVRLRHTIRQRAVTDIERACLEVRPGIVQEKANHMTMVWRRNTV